MKTKHILAGGMIALALLVGATSVSADVFGQTIWRLLGSSVSPVINSWKMGIGTTTPYAKFAITGTSGQANPLFQIASSTESAVFTVDKDGNVTITGTCTGCGSGAAFAWTPTTNYGAATNATSTPVWFQAGLQASTTAHFVYASSTALTVSGNSYLGTVSGGTWNGSTLTVPYGGTGATTLTGILKGNGASAFSAASAGSDYENPLTFNSPLSRATNAISFLYNTANTWTGLNTFGNASSTLFSAYTSYFGGTATTTIGTDGKISVAGASTTPQRDLVVKASASVECDLTDGATVTFNLATCNQGRVTLGGNRTLDFTNETQAFGQGIRFIACQDGTGSRTITWDSAIRWAGGTAPTLTTTANKCDVIAGFTTAATGTPVILLDKSLNF